MSTEVVSLRSSGTLLQRLEPQWLKADTLFFFFPHESLGMTKRPAVEHLRDLPGTYLKGMSER